MNIISYWGSINRGKSKANLKVIKNNCDCAVGWNSITRWISSFSVSPFSNFNLIHDHYFTFNAWSRTFLVFALENTWNELSLIYPINYSYCSISLSEHLDYICLPIFDGSCNWRDGLRRHIANLGTN